MQSIIGKAISLPVVNKIVSMVETLPQVPTGLWFGERQLSDVGNMVAPRLSGAYDILSKSTPSTAALKVIAIKNIISSDVSNILNSLIDIREITQTTKDLITVKGKYGDITPVSMKPETFSSLIDYMNANEKDIRVYGSLVEGTYTGTGGRLSKGDVDALLKSDVAQKHAENLYEIFLNKEYGKGNYIPDKEVEVTAYKDAKTGLITKSPKTTITISENIINPYEYGGEIVVGVDEEGGLIYQGERGSILGRMKSEPSALTEYRIVATTETGEHALDLHPIKNLEYTNPISGINVKGISIENLIWGKQTIGEPPVSKK